MSGILHSYLDLSLVIPVFPKQKGGWKSFREKPTIALCQIIPLDDVIFGWVQRNRLLWSELLLLGFDGVGHGGVIQKASVGVVIARK